MSKMRLIVGAAMADGKLQDAEQPVVLRCAERLGLATEDVQGLFDELTDEQAFLFVDTPEGAADREEILTDLIAVVRADGTVDSDELAFVHAIGELFGVSQETIDSRLGG